MQFFSPFTKTIWEKLCEKKLVYLLIVATWLLPTIINLPKSFEQGVDFQPGKLPKSFEQGIDFHPGKNSSDYSANRSEVGYLCYPTENGTKVMWTDTQFVLNLTTDILVLLAIVISATISWLSFKREISDNRDKLAHDQIRLLRYNIVAKLRKKDLSLSVSIICVTYLKTFYLKLGR